MSILVVDDEELVRSMVCEFLESLGYHAIAAADGEDAMAIAGDRSLKIQAVLADVNMPGMSGPEMWQRMKSLLAPTCRVLFMSGRAHSICSTVLAAGDVLAKPFSFALLEEKLLEMLPAGVHKHRVAG
jgi:CheY-like chemotaxis protein